MNLQQDLNQKASQCSLKELAQFMGYQPKKVKKAVKRIEDVLSDEHLGLNSSLFDFKYVNKEFLNKLCSVLNLDISQYQACLDAIEQSMELKNKGFKSYVFVDTKFKRTNESILILSALESRRYIKIDWDIRKLAFEDQIPLISELIKQHYEQAGGRLKIWGEIQQYAFFYGEGEAIVFKPGGGIQEEQFDVNYGRAGSRFSGVIK